MLPQLAKISVDEQNECYAAIDDVLYKRGEDGLWLSYIPPQKRFPDDCYFIPDTVSLIWLRNLSRDWTLLACPHIAEVRVDEKNKHYTAIDGVLYEKKEGWLMALLYSTAKAFSRRQFHDSG